jgi:hypothetical protein
VIIIIINNDDDGSDDGSLANVDFFCGGKIGYLME